jgi:general secretion pathway protein K
MKHPRSNQCGAALLIAMIVMTLVTTLATSMVWQQWRAVQVEAAERARMQSAWILGGALDWARLILREDSRGGNQYDHLGEPWAVPLAEARLSTFLAADRNSAPDDGPEAFLSGSIADEQSRYNLRNLIDDATKKVDPKQLAILQRLCASAGLPGDVAVRLAESLALAWADNPVDEAPLAPRIVAELTWLGLDPAAAARLEPLVTLLPAGTLVNLNTAPREVLAAVIEGLDLGGAERLTQARLQRPFQSREDASNLFQGAPNMNWDRVDVTSNFFIVRGRLRLGERVLEERSLVERQNDKDIVALRRDRVNLHTESR